MITRAVKWEKQPATHQKVRRLAWHSRRRETHRQDLQCVDRGGRESGTELDGPGLVWSRVERENSKVLLEAAEKYRSIELLFHLPIFWMSALGIPALNAEFAAPRRNE